MAISISTLILLLLAHFLGDFVFQSRTMARNKSTSVKWRLIHVTVYSMFFVWVSIPYALLNGAWHFVVDTVTSKLSSRFWIEEKEHAFFTTIGFDQFLHVLILVVTYGLLFLY